MRTRIAQKGRMKSRKIPALIQHPKRLVISLVLLSTVTVISVALAFLYIDTSGHEMFVYNAYLDDALMGTVTVDRYTTEEKLIFKSTARYDYSEGYPLVTQQLSLDRKTLMPLKYDNEASGVKGSTRSVMIWQNADRTNLLFVRNPSIFMMKDFETGDKTTIFSPYDVMLYMPVMELYNYWKKGAQFFEILIPVDDPMPVLRDKLEMRYAGDAYTPIMGRRVEVERFTLMGRGIPDARISLSKHSHSLLSVEIGNTGLKFVAARSNKRFEELLSGAVRIGKKYLLKIAPDAQNTGYPKTSVVTEILGGQKPADIFFESGSLMLSGRLRMPDGKGPFPSAVLLPEDGPMANGEYFLFRALSSALSHAGIAVLDFDYPGQGKSQGNFRELSDGQKINNVTAAVTYLAKNPLIAPDRIAIIGFKSGGYLAAKAAYQEIPISSCILLGLPVIPMAGDIRSETSSQEDIRHAIAAHGLGDFDPRYIETISAITRKHLEEVKVSREDFLFFMGRKLSLAAYRECLNRKPYETIANYGKPLLMIFGKDDRHFSVEVFDGLNSLLLDNPNVKFVTPSRTGTYMGEIVKDSGIWSFKANPVIIEIITDWIRRSGSRSGDPTPRSGQKAASG